MSLRVLVRSLAIASPRSAAEASAAGATAPVAADHRSRQLIGPLTIEVPPGAIHTLMGPSGSGKSSLLAAVAGALPGGLLFDGEVWLNGRAIDALPTESRRIGLLFQDALLFPHLNVRENLMFGMPRGPRAAREQAADGALREVGLEGLGDADPQSLSGGQRARVALMRALLAQPAALLLDEPFAKLDTDLRVRLREHVYSAIRARGIPALLVTHDVQDVADPDRLTRL